MKKDERNNPFMISFGVEPTQYIERYTQTDEIRETFRAEKPSNMSYMITGVRGSGKTVLLSYLTERFAEDGDWIVINVSPDSDMIQRIAAKLYSRKESKALFVKAKLDLSAFGLGVSIEKGDQIFDIETALEQMLRLLAEKRKRILIAVDEVVNNEHVREFASSYQLLIRQKLPIYLLMTGLYENI